MQGDGAWSQWQRSVFGKRKKRRNVSDVESAGEDEKPKSFLFGPSKVKGRQMTLDGLRNLVTSAAHDNVSVTKEDVGVASDLSLKRSLSSASEVGRLSSVSTTSSDSFASDRKKPAAEFCIASGLLGAQQVNEHRHKSRRKSSLHPYGSSASPPICQSPEPLLAAHGAGEKMVGDSDGELGRYASLVKGEVSAEHVKQILSMKLTMLGKDGISEMDIGGLRQVKSLIRAKVINPIRRPELHFGLYKASRGILFFGPPGTGKTTLAKWIATESAASFFNVSPSSLISKFHGETETLVRTLFLVAETAAPSVIFMDEIDSLIGKRTEKEEDATLRMKNQLLQMMDGVATDAKTVVVIGATNRPDALDEAALRRLPKRIFIPLPDVEARVEQLRSILGKHSAGTDVRVSHLELSGIAGELDGFNGSDLKALCVKAAEFVYEEVLDRFGGIDEVPGPEAFRPPDASDLREAARSVNPSTSGGVDYEAWANQLGCL